GGPAGLGPSGAGGSHRPLGLGHWTGVERSFYAIMGHPDHQRAYPMSLSLAKSNGMNAMDDNKSKALVAALAQIEKQFGKGSIMKMGEAQVQNDLQVVSTGSLGLDIALGVGGLPRGRVVEV